MDGIQSVTVYKPPILYLYCETKTLRRPSLSSSPRLMLLDFISSTTTFLLFTTKDTCHQSLKERLRHWKLLMNFLCFSIEFDHRPPSKFRHHYLSRFRDSVLPGTYKQISCSHFNYTDLDLLLLGPNVVSSSLPVIPYPGNLGASGTTLETESKTFENLQ